MTRLEQQMAFLLEIDKLKQVHRRTKLLSGERYENSAEHTWHIALATLVLAEHSNTPIDAVKVMKMLLVHDLVEIDAGDTPAYGDQGDKTALEAAAAERIFGLLPEDQRDEFTALWREFESRETPESLFANSVDRLFPPIQNIHNQGGSWLDFAVNRPRADARLSPIGDGSQPLWQLVSAILDDAQNKGYIQPGN